MVTVLILVMFIAFACGGNLTEKDAMLAFQREHPDWTVVYAAPGEGWAGVVYYHFKFRKPGDESVHETVWCFEQEEDGRWIVTSRQANTNN